MNMLPLTLGRVIIASTVVALVGISGLLITPLITLEPANMRIEPTEGMAVLGDTFTIEILVSSPNPVNVFAGELVFDPAILRVDSISYNTSIADLWAERPWYSNGDGTLTFAGGTTRKGGFIGTGSIIEVRFKTLTTGDVSLGMRGVRILRHDGLGTDAEVTTPIDTIFTVSDAELDAQTVTKKDVTGPKITILPEAPSTDLNGDGKQSIVDTSIFMQYFATQDKRGDFNLDGSVGTKDMSILLNSN